MKMYKKKSDFFSRLTVYLYGDGPAEIQDGGSSFWHIKIQLDVKKQF